MLEKNIKISNRKLMKHFVQLTGSSKITLHRVYLYDNRVFKRCIKYQCLRHIKIVLISRCKTFPQKELWSKKQLLPDYSGVDLQYKWLYEYFYRTMKSASEKERLCNQSSKEKLCYQHLYKRFVCTYYSNWPQNVVRLIRT